MKMKIILGAAMLFSSMSFAAIKKDDFSIYKSHPVLVAVIDTGCDTQHPDLKKFIWTNLGETGKDKFGNDKENNEIDDDGNGFTDDVHGWNFVNNNNDVSDLVGHGTHVSGIIKNEFLRHTSTGISKNNSLQIMVLKYFNPKAKQDENLKNSTKAIEYANKMQARIINYSGGGSDSYLNELIAIKQSEKQKIVFVAAAGNNQTDTDIEKYYPASYPLSNIISVAASNNSGDLVAFSNFGKSIDIAAPGKLIYSTLPKKSYGIMSGTSQAAAYVSGMVASLYGNNQTLRKPQVILQELIRIGKMNATLQGKIKSQIALLQNEN
ncbi:MAG: S8 family peptidase [Pseudobdellovibrio sp.]